MAPSGLLVASISLISLLGACSRDSTAPVEEIPSVAGQQAESAVEQTWEPVRMPEGALAIRNMPVPDEVLIYEMAAAEAAVAKQQGNPSGGPGQAGAARPATANQPQHDSSADMEADLD